MSAKDQIWANEGGLMIRFERVTDAGGAAALGYVTITIIECSGREEKVLAEATLTDWRWKRAVAAMTPPDKARAALEGQGLTTDPARDDGHRRRNDEGHDRRAPKQ